MNPAIILAGVQALQTITEIMALYGRGELTDEEVLERWNAMNIRVEAANRRWEESG